jgi:uncharacterized membrane protein YqaE (UPF0057 family)
MHDFYENFGAGIHTAYFGKVAIIFPPLAVIDRGCGSVLIVFLLTLCGWIPGVLAALIILNKN